MLTPCVVDGCEECYLCEYAVYLHAVSLLALSQLYGHSEAQTAIGDGECDAHIHVVLALLVYLLHCWAHGVGNHLGLTLIVCSKVVDNSLDKLLGLHRVVLLLRHGEVESHLAHKLEFEVLVCSALVLLDELLGIVVAQVVHVDIEALAIERMTTTSVDNLTLRVHNIVILQQALTHTEVVLLNLLLSALDSLRHHACLDDLAILKTHTVHHRCDTLRAEEAHELILERYEELR